MKYRLCLFDFDYTLVNSEAGILACFRYALHNHGYDHVTDEAIVKTIGLTFEDAYPLLLGTDDPALIRACCDEFREKSDEVMTALTVPYPQTVPTLLQLRRHGVQIGLVSSKRSVRLHETLAQCGLQQTVGLVLGCGEVQRPKPDPEGIQKAMAHFGVTREETLYVGDSYIDAMAAQRAGVDFVGVTTGTTTAQELAAYPHVAILPDLEGLCAVCGVPLREIAVAVPCTTVHLARIQEAAGPNFTVRCCGAEDATAMQNAEIVFGHPPLAQVQQMEALRWLQLSWAGADAYTGGLPKEMVLTNASGAFGVAIAEHMLAMLLALCRSLPHYWLRRGCWQQDGKVRQLAGMTVLVLGTGDIGTAFAARAHALGMQVLGIYHTRSTCPSPYYDEWMPDAALDTLLPRADVVACSLPQTEKTHGMLNRKRIHAMKPGAIVLNVGRGSVLDLDALTDALASGYLYGAGLDVTEPEPLPAEHPLWQMDNVIVTPHVAGVSFGQSPEIEERIFDIFCENMRRWRCGEPLKNCVDLERGY